MRLDNPKVFHAPGPKIKFFECLLCRSINNNLKHLRLLLTVFFKLFKHSNEDPIVIFYLQKL